MKKVVFSGQGHSWESYVIEAHVNSAPADTTSAFFRDNEQNEIDLVLNYSDGSVYAIEIKVSQAKGVQKGFAPACNKIGATHQMVVHTGESDHQPASGVQRLSLISAIRKLQESQSIN